MCPLRFLLAVLILVTPALGINEDIADDLVRFFQRRYEIQIDANGQDNLYLFYQVKKWVGTPFGMFSEDKRKKIGEIELMQEIAKNALCRNIPNSISEILPIMQLRKEKFEPKQGDFLFFSFESSSPSHLGIYLKNGYFVHTNAMQGVKIESLNIYYKEKLKAVGKLPCISHLGDKKLTEYLIE